MAALVWLIGWPPAALAHASLVFSDPPDLCSPLVQPRIAPGDVRCATGVVRAAAPASIRLWFNEPVQLVGGGVRVLAPDGTRVERGPARVTEREVTMGVAAVGEGTYLVIWRVVARDTHPARGIFTFSVGQASPLTGASAAAGRSGRGFPLGIFLQVAARMLHLAGYALGFGGLAFRLLVLSPLGLVGDAAGERRLWRLIYWGILALLMAEPLALLAQTASLSPREALDPDLIADALSSSFGRAAAQRLGAALLLWVLLGALRLAPAGAGWLVLALGLTLGVADGEAAHAINTRPLWLGMGINAIHMAAMGAWVGGVLALLAVWRSPALAGRRQEVAARAGRLAAAALIALAATGTAMALQHLVRPSDLLATTYGRTLVVKLFVLLAALSIARGASHTVAERRGAWWRREAVALLGILALAGLLASLPPPV